MAIYLDGASDARVERNVVVQDGDPVFLRGFDGGATWRRATGVQLAAERATGPLKNVTIRNNLVVGASSGVYYGHYDTDPGLDNVRVWHNTIVDPIEAALFFERIHGQNIDVRGNVFYRGDRGRLGAGHRMSGVAFRGNAWHGATIAAMRGSGDVTADPAFAGGPPREASSYRPGQGSPIIDRAPWTGTAEDITGAARGAPDMGVLER